jgi:UDP-N-acetylmuramoylalanine-D-glutamate ligase
MHNAKHGQIFHSSLVNRYQSLMSKPLTAVADHFIVVLGLARQGLAAARWLAAQGAHVTVSDVKPAEQLTAEIKALRDVNVKFALGGIRIVVG